MRSIVAACAATLVLTGCGGGSDDDRDGGGTDPAPIDDLCGLLPVEDASRVVGVTYTAAKEPAEDLQFPLCSYTQAAIEGPFTLTLSAGPGTLAQAVAGLSFAGEVTEQPIDIPGTDEALLLSTNDGELSVEQVAAAVGRNVFVVTFGGSTDIAVQLMAAAIGQDVPDNASEPVPDACDLDPAATRRIIGTAVEPEPVGSEPAWSSCTWDTSAGTVVTLSIARDAGGVDRYVVEHAYAADGVSPEEISVAGADDARLIEDPDAVISQAAAIGSS